MELEKSVADMRAERGELRAALEEARAKVRAPLFPLRSLSFCPPPPSLPGLNPWNRLWIEPDKATK